MMNTLLLASIEGVLLGWLMGFLSLFLILLVLVQRGKGGGLTGALGGPGGQSAFGSKAGDTFTVITVAVAAIWGFVCAFTMWLLGTHTPSVPTSAPAVTSTSDEDVSGTEELMIPADDSLGLDAMSVPAEESESSNSVQLVPADGAADSAGDEEGLALGDEVSSAESGDSAESTGEPSGDAPAEEQE